ncbi:MAG TPA: carboxypeptidase regulatory-like domain-containing protein [Tepidisphaeraceae bacterium]|jgi:protocatechuate 3,4-dioxygenase beta subunit|nr:carboxypeptidase regulatory-like domain-containing protein [Tepidisphaeraceae bacterium]
MFSTCKYLVMAVLVLTSAALGADYTGTVLTPDNKPVKGAIVYRVEFSRTPPAQVPANLPTTRTDDSGVFRFPHNKPGRAEFIAAADGFGASSAQGNGSAPIQIHLRLRTDLTVTFHTADDKPAVHLRVSLRQIYLPMRITDVALQNFSIPEHYSSPWSAITDANGVCTLPGLPQGGNARLDIDDPRYAPLAKNEPLYLSASPQTHAGPIKLQLAAAISGKITYGSTTRPAAGILVHAQSNDAEYGAAVTDATGSYSIRRLRPDQYTVLPELRLGLEKTWTIRACATVAIAAGENKTGVDFNLIPGSILSGRVLAADDSMPVPGVELGIYNAAHPRNTGAVQSVTTDANGAFSVHVPPGQQTIYIMSDTPADGFGRPTDDEKNVTIAENGQATIEFRLPRAFMSPIKGKVVDPAGNPVAGASVFAYSDQPPMAYNRNAITTNADGTFQTQPVQRSAKVELRAKFQDMATPKSIIVNRAAIGEVVVQLQKNALASLTGRVVDAKGQPLKNAQIELLYAVGRYRFGDNAGATDDQGAYKVDSLWGDMTYSVQATCDGYGESESNDTLHVSPGEATRVPDLTLYQRDSTVAGVLLDRDNKPVAGQRIYVRGPRTGYSNITTGADGKFQCAVVASDRLTIYYNFNTSRGLSRQSAKAGDQNIVLHTAPPVAAAAAAPTHASPTAVSVAESAPVFDPAEAVTWSGWFYAVILLLAGSVVTIIANAVAAIRSRKSLKTA